MGSPQDLDAKEIREEAAALAAHLQRIGVRWLPANRSEAVAKLKLEFDLGVETEALTAQHPDPQSVGRSSTGPSVATKQTESVGQGETSGQAGASGQAGVVASTAPPSSAAAASSPAGSPVGSPVGPSSTANRPASNRPAGRLDPVAAVAVSREPYPGEPLSPPQRQAKLDELGLQVSACERCGQLASCRTRTVFGEGPAQPRFVFFGEGPGQDEDLSGRPFVGRAGELLTKMIEACTLRREDTYILNTVKCRPPGNRNPEPEELANCRPYYQTQLQILRPEYIVCLGAVSAQELLQSRLSVGRLRGSMHRYHDSKVLVTYHPAYLLRNPAAKKAAWNDLQVLMKDAGIAIKRK
ncbi:MAG: uracil-DNA glycosylase [Planctomycetaceae bacterium]|nr:uracil-DNA glycosylase [Planctomycetaceae bacterium]